MPVPALRFYVHTLSEIDGILPYAYACTDKEIQIVVAFANGFDRNMNYMSGQFFHYFDTINPLDIERIKKDAPNSIKFFLSIGGRNPRLPFAVSHHDLSRTWVTNASESLQKIIQKYHFDGIDIYYEYINNNAFQLFPTSISSVIRNLKDRHVITKASITVSEPLIDAYVDLCKNYAELIDNVVFQCFTVTNTTIENIENIFRNKLFLNNPREKILAGYSDFHNDRKWLAPAIFHGALARLLHEGAIGISMWHGDA